jgi:hypothetical protein
LLTIPALNEEKEKARTCLHELSKLYTESSSSSTNPSRHPYKLCGVSTKSGITFIRRQSEPDLIDMDLDENGPASGGDQWWKLAYIATESRPIVVEKVTVEEALSAAMDKESCPILVYASQNALSTPIQPLPDSLQVSTLPH